MRNVICEVVVPPPPPPLSSSPSRASAEGSFVTDTLAMLYHYFIAPATDPIIASLDSDSYNIRFSTQVQTSSAPLPGRLFFIADSGTGFYHFRLGIHGFHCFIARDPCHCRHWIRILLGLNTNS